MKVFIKHNDSTVTYPESNGEVVNVGGVEVDAERLWFKSPPKTHAHLTPDSDSGWRGFLCINVETSDIVFLPDDFGPWPDWVKDPLLRAIKMAEYREGKTK